MPPHPTLPRRRFLGSAATAAAFSIVPRHVVAGSGLTPPSEQIAIANIGCGTQGLREMRSLLQDHRLRVVAVCDPNAYSTNYLDWSPHEIRDRIREDLGNPSWGQGLPGIPGGRDVAREYIDSFYARHRPSPAARGVSTYADFRVLLDREKDLDAVKIMTPDHLHATIALAAMDRGLATITHKPIANRLAELRLVTAKARQTGVFTHLLAWADLPQLALIREWIDAGVIGQLRAIHNWSARPVWKQWDRLPSGAPPIPPGFDWDLWLGPVPPRPYHPDFTHNVFRGWYEFGGGAVADMGHYSLFPLFAALGISRPPLSAKAFGTTTRDCVDQVFRGVKNDVAFPLSCTIRWHFPAQPTLPPFDLFWYDGGIKPFPPEELEVDNIEVPSEGLLLVGDQGKIMGGFRGETPKILPLERMRHFPGRKSVKVENDSYVSFPWVDYLHQGQPSPGSFLHAEIASETINLGAVALRAGTRVDFDSAALRITNNPDANRFLTRDYRPGWELSS